MSPHSPDSDRRSDPPPARPGIARRAIRRLGRTADEVRASLGALVDGVVAPAPSLAPAVIPVVPEGRRLRRGGDR
jgi:hypothetical protein